MGFYYPENLSRAVQLDVILDIQNWLIMNEMLTEKLELEFNNTDLRLPKDLTLDKYIDRVLSVYSDGIFHERFLDKVYYFIKNENHSNHN